MEGKVAVLGNSDFVMPFSAMGLDTYAVDKDSSAQENAKKILEQNYALVVVAENVARESAGVFEVTSDKAVPSVVIVPFTTEPTGIATESLGNILRLATGINILENE